MKRKMLLFYRFKVFKIIDWGRFISKTIFRSLYGFKYDVLDMKCKNDLDTMPYKKYLNPSKHKVVNIIRRENLRAFFLNFALVLYLYDFDKGFDN